MPVRNALVAPLLLALTSCGILQSIVAPGMPETFRRERLHGESVPCRVRGDGAVDVVYLHGNPGYADEARWVEELLLSAGSGQPLASHEDPAGQEDDRLRRFRCLSLDRPGHGWASRARHWTAEDQAELFATLMLREGVEEPILVGHSWGGGLALLMATSPGTRARALVLLGPEVKPDRTLQDWGSKLYLSVPARLAIGETIGTPLARWWLAPSALRKAIADEDPAPHVEEYCSEAASLFCRPAQIRASALDELAMYESLSSRQEAIAGLALPVIVLAGTEDKTVLPDLHAKKLRHIRPSTLLVELEGAGHQLPVTHPKHVADAIAFARDWAGVRAGTPSRGGTVMRQPDDLPEAGPGSTGIVIRLTNFPERGLRLGLQVGDRRIDEAVSGGRALMDAAQEIVGLVREAGIAASCEAVDGEAAVDIVVLSLGEPIADLEATQAALEAAGNVVHQFEYR